MYGQATSRGALLIATSALPLPFRKWKYLPYLGTVPPALIGRALLFFILHSVSLAAHIVRRDDALHFRFGGASPMRGRLCSRHYTHGHCVLYSWSWMALQLDSVAGLGTLWSYPYTRCCFRRGRYLARCRKIDLHDGTCRNVDRYDLAYFDKQFHERKCCVVRLGKAELG